ncbi:MAG: leucine-rich repeat domain-containing protein [Clostridia bacterium]|nr:leucine-rich repeat domain-containing protein [Clostridia bacterium]
MKNRSKKIVAIIGVLSILAVSVVMLTACNKSLDNNVEYKVEENGEITIVGYTDSTLIHEITIPDEIDGKPVTKVGAQGVVNAENLYTIYIGKNVKEIDTWAFTNLVGLGADEYGKNGKGFVVDPENPYFTAVDGVLFNKDMTELIYYPIRKGADIDNKMNVESYATYVIPEGVKSIRGKAFYHCYYLREVTLPSTLENIGEMAFFKCSELATPVLPEGLKTIGKDAFSYCTRTTEGDIKGFTSINIPASVESIGEFAFYNCRAIETITIYGKTEAQVEALQDDGTFGTKWYPTDNGRKIKTYKIVYA